ncbi:MAG: TolC family protein [Bryobacteraceae bacterium]
MTSFPKPDYFREAFTKPHTRVQLEVPVRLGDFVANDKMELSLRSFLELVMANNTEIALSRLVIETAQNAITRAYAPFDPVALASFRNQRSRTPANDVLAGATTLSTLNQPLNLSYQQLLQNGTNYTVSFFGTKNATNSGFQNFNPAINTNLSVNFAQPLLRNRGTYVNRLPLMIARSRLRVNEYTLRDNLLRILSEAELTYWALVEARENLAVAESGLNLAGQSLQRSERELELGAISELDIFQPQAVYAAAKIQVAQATYFLRQREDALRRQMGADLDPDFRKMPIVLTESVLPPTDAPTTDPEMAVEAALALRPDLKAAIQTLDVDDLQIKTAANQLKPDLSITGSYTAQGRGGIFNQRTNVFDQTGSASTIVNTIPGGLGDAFDQLFGFGFPVYSFGLQLRLPIRDRAASAAMADAVVNKRRDALQVRNLTQGVRLEVLTAVNQVESSKASVELAVVARDLAQKRLDAEQKKYELGTSQIFFVLQAQNDLINSQSALVRESVGYRRNQLNLLRRTGELLEERGVIVQ